MGRFSAAFYCFCSYMPSFLAANVPGMTRAMSLVSTMVHLVFVGGVAIATGCYSDRGGPRMILSAVVHLLGGAALAPAALAIRYGGVVAAWLVPLAFQILVGTFGGLLAVSMCPLYPPEVRSSGMNFAHQVSVCRLGLLVLCSFCVLCAVVCMSLCVSLCVSSPAGGQQEQGRTASAFFF